MWFICGYRHLSHNKLAANDFVQHRFSMDHNWWGRLQPGSQGLKLTTRWPQKSVSIHAPQWRVPCQTTSFHGICAVLDSRYHWYSLHQHLSVDISISAVNCLERLVYDMTYNVSSGTRNSACVFTHSMPQYCKVASHSIYDNFKQITKWWCCYAPFYSKDKQL